MKVDISFEKFKENLIVLDNIEVKQKLLISMANLAVYLMMKFLSNFVSLLKYPIPVVNILIKLIVSNIWCLETLAFVNLKNET